MSSSQAAADWMKSAETEVGSSDAHSRAVQAAAVSHVLYLLCKLYIYISHNLHSMCVPFYMHENLDLFLGILICYSLPESLTC